ncbi:MEFV protein, partial [Polyodon spathula]|nr:MEFV protein [Polyodon spathula]
MVKTWKDEIIETLEELLKDDLKRFKSKLHDIRLEEGHQNIPRGRLENADAIDIVELVSGYYGEQRAGPVVVRVLKAINQMELAARLENTFS